MRITQGETAQLMISVANLTSAGRWYLHLTLHAGWLAYIALFSWITPLKYIASKIVYPLLQITFFSLLGRFITGSESTNYYVIGNAVQTLAIGGIYGVSMVIGEERGAGTLAYLIGSPANRVALFAGRILISVIDSQVSVVAGFVLAVSLFDVDFSQTNFAWLVPALLLTTLSTAGLGLLIGSVNLLTYDVMFLNNVIYTLMLLVTGVNIPVESLPFFLQILAYVFPLTRGLAAIRLIIAGSSPTLIGPLLWGELAIGLVYFVLGYLFFHFLEQQGRTEATLEDF